MGQPTRPAYNPGMAAPRWSIHKFALLFALALLARGVPAADSGTVSLRGFTNDLGQVIEADSPRGATTLMVFGYTTCPDVCPLTLVAVHQALAQLAKRGLSCDVAFVTVDPDRDTGQILTSYLDTFVKGRGVALRTTDPAQQQTAQEAFRVVAKRVPDGDTYSFEHTAVTYVVDDTGTVVVEWPFGTSSATMAHDMEILLSGDGQAATR